MDAPIRLAFVFCASALTLAACQDADNAPAPTEDYQGCLDDGSCVCESSAECPEGQSCDAGQCVADAGCQSGADCAVGEVCQGGACVPEVIPDGDRDGDGIPDIHDTCANIPNPDQLDLDGDGRGDVCDDDIDGDGLVNGADNCRQTFNPMQEDPDGDGLGLACVGGDRAQPFSLPLGVALQRLDTRTRQDDFSGSCGGEGAPDVVYSAPLREGETVRATIEADHAVVIQVVGPGGSEAGCEAGGSLSFTAPTTGTFLFVIDGAGNEDAGLVTVQASVFRDPAGAQSDDYATNSAGAVWVGHVNDDAALDVVSADPGMATVSVRLGAQDGSLGDPIAFRVDGNPAAVWGGDLNNDDAPDLAVVLDDQDVVAVLFNNSEGRAVSFESPQTFAVGADPAAVWGGDLNNSGTPDLVVANSADGTVSVLINNDQGGFAAAQNLDVGEGPVAVWGGDLNNSGAPDLVVANAGGGVGTTASVLMNDGTGGFGTASAIDTGQGPVGVWGGDLNNDGAPDLAIAHDGATVGGLVSIFAGRGDGTFEAPTSHAIGEGPWRSGVAI